MTIELFREDSYLRQCQARVVAADDNGLRLDRTIFYPSGGGQPGDSGSLTLADGSRLFIIDARKDEAGILHIPTSEGTMPEIGTEVTVEIDWERRFKLMRMHTCLHLLCAVVPGGVTGGSVGEEKGRLDFDLAADALDKERIAEDINRLIAENHPVRIRWIEDAELEAQPELVRTMSVKPPSGQGRVRLIEIDGVDLQPCGGTHLASTGEVGPVVVTKIENKGKRNRRVNIAFADSYAANLD